MNPILANDVAIAVVFALSGWMLKTWLSHRERMRGLSLSQHNIATSDQRLARVEQAVESIAIEVERISEGQRFVTKLLSDPKSPGAAGAGSSGFNLST
jgi:hypothetical protein